MCQPGTTLVLAKAKPAYSLLFPQRSGPYIPSPYRLGLTFTPLPPPPATPAAPPCAASPQEPCCPLIWSDTATYSRRRCSQGRPSHPRAPVVHNPLSLCSYGSVTIEPSHMGAPLHCMLNPQRSQQRWQHAHRQDWWFFGGPPGGWVSTWRQTKKSAQLLSVVSL